MNEKKNSLPISFPILHLRPFPIYRTKMKNSLKVAPSNTDQLKDLVKTIQALIAENEKIEELVSQLEQEVNKTQPISLDSH